MGPLEEFRAFTKPDEPLAPLTWFRLGGRAEFLARPRNLEDLVALLRRARSADLPIRILSAGSNVLVRDSGVKGVVILLESPAFSDVTIHDHQVETGSAVPLTALISQTARAGLAGLEILTGIPGTVGGALKGNSGGRQGAIGHFARQVTIVDAEGDVQAREKDDLSFGYRSSNLDDGVIISARFALDREDPEAVVKRMRRIWIVKKENQPYGHQSSGCIFKNPTVDISAGMLVEQVGVKGAKQGGAEGSDRLANYTIAQAGAKSEDVLTLIDTIRQKVWQQFGYDLELQIQVW